MPNGQEKIEKSMVREVIKDLEGTSGGRFANGASS